MAVKDSAIITILLITVLPMLVLVSVVPNSLSLPGVTKGIEVTSVATIMTTETGATSAVTVTNQLGLLATQINAVSTTIVTTLTSSVVSFSATSSTYVTTSTSQSTTTPTSQNFVPNGGNNGAGSGGGGSARGHGGVLDLLPLALATQQPWVITQADGSAVSVSPLTLDVAFSLSLVGVILALTYKKRT